MSKNLGKTAAVALIGDIFGAELDQNFRLRPPESFDFFNSLRLIEVDTFSGVTVSLVKSVFWNCSGEIASKIEIDRNCVLYAGSFEGELPENVTTYSEDFWLVVSSRQLELQGGAFDDVLQARGCVQEIQRKEEFFMLLRAHELLSLDNSQKLIAEEEIKWQSRETGYQDTPVSDFYQFYESIAIYRVSTESPLAGRSVFWYSYLVASCWKGSIGAHITPTALQYIDRIYDDSLWHFPIDNARVAVVAAHFKHTFIDLYRCLEWLYSLPRSLRLKAELGLPMKGTDLARAFREKLAWRRAEQDSLKLLLLDAGPESLDVTLIAACLLEALPARPTDGQVVAEGQPETVEKWSEIVATALSKRIYAIRNQFVHQLDSLDHQELTRESEPAFISLLAQLCAILYKKYAAEF